MRHFTYQTGNNFVKLFGSGRYDSALNQRNHAKHLANKRNISRIDFKLISIFFFAAGFIHPLFYNDGTFCQIQNRLHVYINKFECWFR